jgi:energy-coupling factor transport system permease protein
MLRDITIGQHFPGNSLVHRFDPRLKLVLTVAYIVLLFAASNPLGLTLSILFLGVMYKVAKIPVKKIGKSLKPILDSMWAWGEDYKRQQELADA